MNTFVKKPAKAMSISQRKLVHSKGVNDASYIINPKINGKSRMCPVYTKWQNMLARCYSKEFHKRQPTYIGSTVCTEWLIFSNFSKWFELNNIEGYELDKDIKIKGNKVYSPNTCLFVPRCVNKLLNDSGSTRGKYPQGVCLYKKTGKFISQIRSNGKARNLGYFSTAELAHKAYMNAKNNEILRYSKAFPKISKYLKNHLFSDI